jgi:predicted amidophosphoribosyltransferase
MNVCTSCGQRTQQKACPECNQPTTPEDLIPNDCKDCGAPLTLAPHVRTSLGQCEDCADQHRTIIGLRAWDDLL